MLWRLLVCTMVYERHVFQRDARFVKGYGTADVVAHSHQQLRAGQLKGVSSQVVSVVVAVYPFVGRDAEQYVQTFSF